MTSTEITERLNRRQEALLLGWNVGGLVYMNESTGELTISQDEVLGWMVNGDRASVKGYYAFEWDGEKLNEVWITDSKRW